MSADSNLFRLHLILSWEGSTTLTATSCRPNRWGKGPAPERHRSPRQGGKADIVLIDLKHLAMRPMRKPLRSLLYVAAERAVNDVCVAGRLAVKTGIA